MKIEECRTYLTLKKNLASGSIDYQLIFYNNSPEIVISETTDYKIFNSKENSKLYGAYNFALKHAIHAGRKWLLLLDQDTEITSEYINELSQFLKREHKSNLAAVAPILKEGEKILSPKIISSVGWWQRDIEGTGYQRGRISAFNSLTLISVPFIQSLGGFTAKFPLDMLDHWYYNQMYLQKKEVYVLNSVIKHSLSLLNYEENINLTRHVEFLNAESRFVREELGLLHYFFYKIRLFLRLIRQLLVFKDKEYPKITFKRLMKNSQNDENS